MATPRKATKATASKAAESRQANLTPDQIKALKIQTAVAWRPQVGEIVKGTLVKIVKREGEYGPYPCVILDTGDPDNFTAVHAFHGVLLNQLREIRPTAGDEIAILYSGKRDNAKGKTDASGAVRQYHGYAVFTGDGDASEEFDLDADVDPENTGPGTTPAKAAPRKRAAKATTADTPGF